MTSKPAAPDTDSERHSRKCSICHHPHRDAIEEEFLHWHRVIWIAQQYQLPDHRSIYRHARATGLIQARRENLHSALDNIVEQSDGIQASASDVLKAIRAYSCLDAATGRWTDLPAPPKQVHLTYRVDSSSSRAETSPNLSSRGSRVSADAEGPAVSSDSVAAGGPLPTKRPTGHAEAPASGFVGRDFSRDTNDPAEGQSTDSAPFAEPTSATGDRKAEALASGRVGRDFSRDTENGAEDPSTFEASSASPASAAGGPMPTPIGERPVSGHGFNRADNAAVADPSTDSAPSAEPAETDSQVSANALEGRFLTIEQRDYYDRAAGIDRRPYGRR